MYTFFMADHTAAIFEPLISAGYLVRLSGFSALDRYMGFNPLPFVYAETDIDISGLARLLEKLRFPGPEIASGAVDTGGQSWYFRCTDSENENHPSFAVLSLRQDWKTKRFQDSLDLYPLFRELRDGRDKKNEGFRTDFPPPDPWWTGVYPGTERYQALMDGALILARYETRYVPPVNKILRFLDTLPEGFPPKPEGQRLLLTGLLVSHRPDLGLELLKAAGFISEFWPELALLDDVDHSKEYHPEGNVWRHTLETFRYRKSPVHNKAAYDLRLSLGLLLHDVGKPLAASSGSRRFDGHAELGAQVGQKFLERLEFDRTLINDVYYLVKNHMLPAALPRLPLSRTREILESELFPTLLELYRCDESSSFKGLNGYYESSAAYQAYLRNRRNPYRSADGKKISNRAIL
jgi:poly(A) polymerase